MPDASLVYIHDITDTSRWTPGAVVAMSYLVGAYISGPIVRGEAGVRAAQRLRDIYQATIEQAIASDANASGEGQAPRPTQLSARGS